MNKLIHKLENVRLVYLSAVIGLLLIIFPKPLTSIAPYLVGALLILRSLASIAALLGRSAIASRLILGPAKPGDCYVSLILGVMLIVHGGGAIGPLGSIWAVLSLFEVGGELNEMVHERKFPPVQVVITLVMTALAVMLLFDPVEHFTFHVRILGIEMILSVLQKLDVFNRLRPNR